MVSTKALCHQKLNQPPELTARPMVILTCRVKIKSSLCLEVVAKIISAHLLGGVSFVGKDHYVRDEVPAVYSSEYVFGCRFLLHGGPDEEGYYLEVSHHKMLTGLSAAQMRESVVDISADIVQLLESVGGIRATFFPTSKKVTSYGKFPLK